VVDEVKQLIHISAIADEQKAHAAEWLNEFKRFIIRAPRTERKHEWLSLSSGGVVHKLLDVFTPFALPPAVAGGI
jgi:hypothetical protein